MADVIADSSLVLPLVTFAPHWEYFYPTRFAQSLSFQIAATSIVPKAHQVREHFWVSTATADVILHVPN